MRTIFTLLITLALVTGCSMNPTAGGTTDTGNGVIAGTVVDTLGNPVSNTHVTLIPEFYNPVEDPADQLKTNATDASGNFAFSEVDSGTYNFQAYNTVSGTRLLIFGVIVNKDTVDMQNVMLRAAGVELFTLPDTVDTVSGYVYIPGTILYENLCDERLIYDNGFLNMVFDSLPAGTLPGIYYGEINSPDAPVRIIEEFSITEGDTTDVSIKRSWSAYTITNSGLPQNNVVAVMVDASGVLWLGTHDSGLVTFDGSGWSVFNTTNSSLPHNSVLALAQDSNGSIWIGTADGLVNIVNNTWQVYTAITHPMTEDHINDIGIDTQAGRKWLATLTGACMYDDNTWHFHSMVNSIPLSEVHAVAVSSRGTVKYGTNVGIFSCGNNDENWEFMPVLGNQSMNIIVWDIAIDRNNTSWLATPSGVISYNEAGLWGVYNTVTAGLPGNNFKSVAVYTDNSVWAGTHADGTIVKLGNSLGIYDGANTEQLLGAGTINAIVVGDNTLYLATENRGLILLRFTH